MAMWPGRTSSKAQTVSSDYIILFCPFNGLRVIPAFNLCDECDSCQTSEQSRGSLSVNSQGGPDSFVALSPLSTNGRSTTMKGNTTNITNTRRRRKSCTQHDI
mmetsp:Transcript_3531/g.7017  ORF Transcript_3531/g.7017 Transcript_3531/m.7017 type:complete len:103 (+) Transcript_3531:12-320(+)